MSRAASRQAVGVALFPFLAVLICTMGALIVLLVLLVQQARVDASTLAASGQDAAPADQELRERLEDAQWRRETLEGSRAEKTQELADSRAKLTHLEEHLQRLQARAKELIEQAQRIDEGAQVRADDLSTLSQELAQVQREADRQKQKVAAARKSAAQESWYALIPYEGPQGTRRRPIYLECTEQGVVLQPEGLLLKAQDFQGPLGPGNPLDAALRMIRAHLEQVHGAKAGQPYPLVVVRPSGVAAYGAARAALKSWDDEFGYELIDDDKRLDFGAPDSALAASLERTVAVARQKQAAMAAMMPRRFQSEEPLPSFALESSRAAQPAPGSGGLGTGSGSTVGPVNGGSRNGATGNFAAAGAERGGYGTGHAGDGSAQGANPAAGGSPGAPGAGPGGSAASGGSPAAATAGPALGSPAGNSLSGGGAESGNTAAAGNLAGAANGAAGGPSGPPAGTPGGAGGGGAFSPGRTGGQPVPNLPLGQSNSNASAASATSSGSTAKGGSKTGKTRGRNWALTGAKPHAIGVTRPLSVIVQPDRVLIVPERGDSRVPVVVPLAPEVRPADVEQFVTAVQREIQGWGLAVAGGYWKPVLQVDVAATAEPQFQALQAALDGSGFDLVRKQP